MSAKKSDNIVRNHLEVYCELMQPLHFYVEIKIMSINIGQIMSHF